MFSTKLKEMARKIEKNVKKAFDKVKEEMTDHLDTINRNTNEIKSNHNYIIELEKMIVKLNERIDNLNLKISELKGETKDISELRNIQLNPKEVEIFKLLYENMGDLFDYKKISRSLGFTQTTVKRKINSMIDKGIPIVKKYFDNNTFLVLDADFRNLQAKNNVLKLN